MTTTETPQTGAELRASIVQDAAEIIRRHQGSPAEDAADALIDMIEQRTLMPLAGELGRLRGVLDTLRTRLEADLDKRDAYTEMGLASAIAILDDLYQPAKEGDPS